MNKWFLLDNGKIKGPFDLTEAQALVANNPYLYAWQPLYSHWTPVNQISHFKVAADIPPPPLDIPEELRLAFVEEERELLTQLDKLDSELTPISDDISEVTGEINRYLELTQSLNSEVSSVIANIEKQYAALQQNLAIKTKLN